MAALRKTMGHAAIYAVGVILARAASFVMLPIYTRVLEPAQYGKIDLLDATVEVVSIVMGMGVAQGLYRFYYAESDAEGRKEVVSTIFLMVLAGYGLACVAGVSASAFLSRLIFETPEHWYLVTIAFVNLLLSFLVHIPLNFLQARQQPVPYVIVGAAKLVLQVGFNLLFVVAWRMGVLGALYSTMIATGVVGGVMTAYTFSQVGLRFRRARAWSVFQFGYPLVGMSLAAFITTYSDRFFLQHARDTASVGLYGLAYKFGFLLMMFPVRPLFNVWMVQRFEIVKRDDHADVFNRFVKWFALITVAAALALSLGARDALRIMADEAFWSAYVLVPVIVLAYLIQASTDVSNFGIYHSGRTQHMTWATGAAAAAILILNATLIPAYGGWGAAWATLVGFTVRLVWVYAASQRVFYVPYRLYRPVMTVAVAIGLVVADLGLRRVLPGLNPLAVSIPFSLFLYASFPVWLSMLNVIQSEDRRQIIEFLRAPRRTIAGLRAPSA